MPQEIGESPTILAEQKVEACNNIEGSLGYVNCPICKNKGYIAFLDNGEFKTRECECMAKRRSIKRIHNSGLSDMVELYTLDNYKAEEPWQKSIKAKAREFIENSAGKWFVATGSPGTGKTHICTAIASELINKGKEVRYMLWRSDAPRLKAMVNDYEAYECAIREYKSVDILYIDDFLKGGITAADINLAFELLNARYNSRSKATMISSEKSIGEILDIDEALGSRIYERSKGFCIKTPNKNWRLRA